MSKAAEDLGGVIVRTAEFVSDPPQERRGAPPPCNQHPGSAIKPASEPQGLRALIIALDFVGTLKISRSLPEK
jgi:hypothetical protein